MKTTRLSKALLFVLLALVFCVAAAFALAACDQSSGKGETVITEYDATLDAVVTMGNSNVNFTENLIDGVYVTQKDGKNEVTVIFRAGEVAMPYNNTMTGIMNATKSTDHFGNEVTPVFGFYNGETLVTDGVVLTYTSDNDFVTVGGSNIYYVKSMAFTVDELASSYKLSVYVTAFNEKAASGMQFPYTSSNGTVTDVELKINLDNGKTVEEVGGLGSDTLGTAPKVFVKYDAVLDASITMGPMGTYNLGENVLEGAYLTAVNGSYSLCIVLKAGELTVAGISGVVYADDEPANPTETNGIKDGTFGAYGADGELITEGVVLTYSSGDNYVTSASGENVYYVQSVTMPVDGVREAYGLAVYLNSAMMGKQFSNDTYKATLKIDLESGEVVEKISGLGAETRGVAPQKYTKYDASLDAVVTMGNSDVNFTENLIDSVYVLKNGEKSQVTVVFKSGEVAMPYNNKMTGVMNGTPSTDYFGNEVKPVYGYYNGETLVTEGVTVTYTSGDDYVTIKDGSMYYVKTMTFTVDELAASFNLSVYVTAFNETASSGMQFPYTSTNGGTSNAVLTIDLESGAEEVASIYGVATLGTVPAEE